MKATNLMIGNLVYSTFSQEPCRIVCIEQYPSEYCMVKVDKVVGIKDIVSLSEIPLTDEILSNNFEITPQTKSQWMEEVYDNEGETRYTIDVEKKLDGSPYLCYIENCEADENVSTVFNGLIRYVHELQNALHQCGIKKEITL